MTASDPTPSEMILYQTPDGALRVEVYHHAETFWLTQKQIATLFGVTVPTVSRHLQNIYAEGELHEPATVAEFATVRTEGDRSVSRSVAHYDLDAIISVGYRVNSTQATRFRIHAFESDFDRAVKQIQRGDD